SGSSAEDGGFGFGGGGGDGSDGSSGGGGGGYEGGSGGGAASETLTGAGGASFVASGEDGFTGLEVVRIDGNDAASTRRDGRVVLALNIPATVDADLVVDTAADDQPYSFSTSRADCTDGVLDGDCTLREAILVANDNPGGEGGGDLDTIGFEILDTFGAVSGVATISPSSALPALEDDGISIDGYTQPGSSPNTLAVGSDAVIRVQIDGQNADDPEDAEAETEGITLFSADDVLVRGLAVYGFSGAGIRVSSSPRAVIEGNHIGTDASGTQRLGNVFGVSIFSPDARVGTDGDGQNDAGERNVISGNNASGVSVGTGAGGTVIAGNYIGIAADGQSRLGNTNFGVFGLFTSDVLVGTDGDGQNDAAERNVIAANFGEGIRLQDAARVVIAGNYIGTDATGLNGRGNSSGSNGGIYATSNSPDLRVGTDGDGENDAAERNVIAANGGTGVRLRGTPDDPTPNAVIAGNYIGVAADGETELGNAGAGVLVEGARGARVGGTGANEGNTIANNRDQGVSVTFFEQGGSSQDGSASVLGNAIFDNGDLGIDLEGGTEDDAGVTANDAGDVDDGPNDLQNYPVITAVTPAAEGTYDVAVTLDSQFGTYRVEVFASEDADLSGFGEGARFLGSTTVSVGEGGTGSGTVTGVDIALGEVVTATATQAGEVLGGTSEFSAAVAVAPTVQFAQETATASEGETVGLEVTLSEPAPEGGVTVDVTFVGSEDPGASSADLGGFTSETVTFAVGESSRTVAVTVTDDGAAEGAETFDFTLLDPSGAEVGSPSGLALTVGASVQT
ncbi:Calx-beta domain-containing protein, partial [Rubrivirga sp.]|uniref:Calx-beta domain-containing protein n=1 Tax=Rubrivirga sp. TaxID=1885344 RepID=UPI003C76105C